MEAFVLSLSLCYTCRYRISCEASDSFLSLSVDRVDLEPPVQCPGSSQSSCLDYLQLDYPTGSQCTACGSGGLRCEENGRDVDSLLTFNGQYELGVEFQSNRLQESCGFRLLATCTRKTFFSALNCTTVAPPTSAPPPTPFPPGFGKRVWTPYSIGLQ